MEYNSNLPAARYRVVFAADKFHVHDKRAEGLENVCVTKRGYQPTPDGRMLAGRKCWALNKAANCNCVY